VSFSINAFGYDFTCANHTYTWSFGDNSATVTGQNTNHAFAQGTYTVRCTVANSTTSFTAQAQVVVGTGGTPTPSPSPTPTPTPTPGGCATLSASTVFISFAGPTSGCTHNGGNCTAGEAIGFNLAPFGYDFTCANHTFTWTFGDTGTASTQNPTHPFTVPGSYNVACVINNGTRSYTATAIVNVVGTSPGTPTATVSFTAEPFGSSTLYKFVPAVDPPTTTVGQWQWDFGDGGKSTASSTKPEAPQYHQYAGTGSFTVTLTAKTATGGVIGVATKTVNIVQTRPRAVRH
jgi:PKD repeat protein